MCMFERVLVLELKKVYVGISIFSQRGKCMPVWFKWKHQNPRGESKEKFPQRVAMYYTR